MDTITENSLSRKTIIDINPKTFQGLSKMADSRGISVEQLIETSLDELVAKQEASAAKHKGNEAVENMYDDDRQAFLRELGL